MTVKELKKIITKDILIDLYVTKDLSYSEIASMYNTTPRKIQSIKDDYKLKKLYKNSSEKRKVTCLQKYNAENPMQVLELKNKQMNACYENYGVLHPSQNKEVLSRMQSTCVSKFGVKNPMYNNDITNKQQKNARIAANKNVKKRTEYQISVLESKENLYNFIMSLPIEERTLFILSEKLNYAKDYIGEMILKYGLSEYVNYYSTTSHYEDEIEELIRSFGIMNIDRNSKSYLNGKEIDIYLPDYKLGIEFNGNYWHSDACEKEALNGRSTYHQKKSLLAENKGIFLFHIFEYEWTNQEKKNKIINILRNMFQLNSTKIYARNCKIRTVNDSKVAHEFLTKNHVQGKVTAALHLGLYYNDELVSIMCFRKPTQGKHTYELVRFCSKAGTNVIGGASKLFSYFTNNYLQTGNTVVSYNDITKTKGGLYKILNFKFTHISSPNYVWWNPNTNNIKSRYQCQMKNEDSEMHKAGYYRICDCGTKTWVYTK